MLKTFRRKATLTPTPFGEKMAWTYYELWHHAGRRARMGTAMLGSDYTPKSGTSRSGGAQELLFRRGRACAHCNRLKQ